MLKFFTESEFKNATPSCSLSQMDSIFMRYLDIARSHAGVPFKINSAFRSVEYEKLKGRSGTSSHCKGLAVDIACYSPSLRFQIVTGLLYAGFTRIGIYKRFIHVDLDNSKPDSFWLGK